MSAPLREAASVIVLRRATPGFEVLLLRRRKGASFMASAFVFPGGGADANEEARTCAARELFEEAGVLLARPAGDGAVSPQAGAGSATESLRRQILDGADSVAVLAAAGLAWSTEVLVPWSHWITPSIEPRRFSAQFFVCELPTGQEPRFDDVETVEQVWVTPADAIARAGELRLPPPQLRTMWELSELTTVETVLAAGHRRAREPHPILPRLASLDAAAGSLCLLLPWDPQYAAAGTGDSAPLGNTPAWARGPSRFVMEGHAWRHVAAPGSTSAG